MIAATRISRSARRVAARRWARASAPRSPARRATSRRPCPGDEPPLLTGPAARHRPQQHRGVEVIPGVGPPEGERREDFPGVRPGERPHLPSTCSARGEAQAVRRRRGGRAEVLAASRCPARPFRAAWSSVSARCAIDRAPPAGSPRSGSPTPSRRSWFFGREDRVQDPDQRRRTRRQLRPRAEMFPARLPVRLPFTSDSAGGCSPTCTRAARVPSTSIRRRH